MKPILKPISTGTHIQIKNILFTTDFSDAAKAAAPYAAALAKRYGAKLYALHVRSPIVNTLTLPENWRALEKIAEIEAQREKFALVHTFAGMHPEILINEGDLWPNIKAAIQEHDIDMIVMGTRGRSGIGKFLLGSAAEEIFRQAPCPVLTVGPHSPAVPKSSGEITRILLATDFGPESQAAASYAISLAQECQAYLTLLHVIDAPKRATWFTRLNYRHRPGGCCGTWCRCKPSSGVCRIMLWNTARRPKRFWKLRPSATRS